MKFPWGSRIKPLSESKKELKKAVDAEIGKLWSGKIEQLIFDLPNHRISMTFKLYYEVPSIHKMAFEEVSGFHFFSISTNLPFNSDAWENSELSEIHYFPGDTEWVEYISKDKKGYQDI